MIFIPDQSIIRMGIRMLHRPHADVLVSDQGGNRCRIDRDADAVEAQFVGIHHMCDPSPDHRSMPCAIEPFIDFTFSGFSGGNQQIIGQQLRGLHRIIFPGIQCMSLGDHCHPGFFIHRQHVEFLCVIRGRDHGNLTQSLCYAVIHIICVAVPQIVLYMRMSLLKSRDPFRKKARATALYRSNVQRTLQAFLPLSDILLRPVHQVQDLIRILQEQLSLFCQGHFMGCAKEQCRPQLRLQILDLTAQGRLRDRQLLRGFREAFLLRHCLEIPDMPQFHLSSILLPCFFQKPA